MNRKDFVLFLLVVTIWGANFTVIKLGLGGVPPVPLFLLALLLDTPKTVIGAITAMRSRSTKAMFLAPSTAAAIQDICVFTSGRSRGCTQRGIPMSGPGSYFRMVPEYCLFVLEVIKVWIDPAVKNPRTCITLKKAASWLPVKRSS
jgi:hypothetical protein